MRHEQIKNMLSDLWEILGNLGTIQPQPGIKDRFWAKVHEEENLRGRSWQRFIRGWQGRASILMPALAFAALILVMLLGTYATLKVMPRSSIASQNKSPILLWAQSASGNMNSGGFSL